jgi:hypothetical protein
VMVRRCGGMQEFEVGSSVFAILLGGVRLVAQGVRRLLARGRSMF